MLRSSAIAVPLISGFTHELAPELGFSPTSGVASRDARLFAEGSSSARSRSEGRMGSFVPIVFTMTSPGEAFGEPGQQLFVAVDLQSFRAERGGEVELSSREADHIELPLKR